MSEALTREKAAEHVATAGIRCPFCGSGDLEPQGYGSRDCGVLDWKIYCYACEETYTELYQLVGLDTEDVIDVRDAVVAMLKREPILILLEGGLVQGVGLPRGLATDLPVAVMAVDSRDFEQCELTEYVRVTAAGESLAGEAHFYTPLIWEHTNCGVWTDNGESTDIGVGYQEWLAQQEPAESAALQAGRSLLQTGPPDLEESLEDSE